MRRISIILCLILLATGARAASPRLTFERVVPAPLDLGRAEEVVLVRASGEPQAVEVFVDTFLGQVGQSGLLRASDGRRTAGGKGIHLGFDTIACALAEREGEGSARDRHGNRVKRLHQWVDASCTASVAILSHDLKTVSSFRVRGEGTSPRVAEIRPDERRAAIRQAARYAAIAAADQITPRRIRESIELDDSAPAFESGMSFVRTGRLQEARVAWERALAGNGEAAALHFDLAAVCEALGDRTAAEKHYKAARTLAPANDRYEYAMRLFIERSTSP